MRALDALVERGPFFYAAVVYYDKIARLVNRDAVAIDDEVGDNACEVSACRRHWYDAFDWYDWCHGFLVDHRALAQLHPTAEQARRAYEEIAPAHKFVRELQYFFRSRDPEGPDECAGLFLSETTAGLVRGVLSNTLEIRCINCDGRESLFRPDSWCPVCEGAGLERTTLLDDFRLKLLRDSLLDDGWPDGCWVMYHLAQDLPRFEGAACVEYLLGRANREHPVQGHE